MTLIEGDDVIEQVAAATLNPPLGNAILPRTLERSANTFDFHRPDRSGSLGPILGIPVEDHKSGNGAVWKGFPQLLHNPQARRMPCHVEMQDAPPIMADDEEAVEHPKREGWNGEEVHRRNGLSMIA